MFNTQNNILILMCATWHLPSGIQETLGFMLFTAYLMMGCTDTGKGRDLTLDHVITGTFIGAFLVAFALAISITLDLISGVSLL